MFTRFSIALTVSVLLGVAPLSANERETQRSESLQQFRDLCETLVSKSSDPTVKTRCSRFLDLSKLRIWTNLSGKTIFATYLGHDMNSNREPTIYLEMSDGRQYAVKLNVLSVASQDDARELKLLVPAIGRDAQRFENQLASRQQQQQSRSVPVGVSATFAEFSYPTPVYPAPIVHFPTYHSWHHPHHYGPFPAPCPYNPWATGPFSVGFPIVVH